MAHHIHVEAGVVLAVEIIVEWLVELIVVTRHKSFPRPVQQEHCKGRAANYRNAGSIVGKGLPVPQAIRGDSH